jgi:hypothetical protein
MAGTEGIEPTQLLLERGSPILGTFAPKKHGDAGFYRWRQIGHLGNPAVNVRLPLAQSSFLQTPSSLDLPLLQVQRHHRPLSFALHTDNLCYTNTTAVQES